jgi:hypothetical protein
MGLDMYLEAECYISEYDEQNNELIKAIEQTAPLGLAEFKPKSITFELAYWRKANAIHGWFVKNVQGGKDDCQSSYVTQEQLKELKETCEKVLENIELAPELLPTTSGFFFGAYEYDEWYERDLNKTVNILDKILAQPLARKWYIQYRASW